MYLKMMITKGFPSNSEIISNNFESNFGTGIAKMDTCCELDMVFMVFLKWFLKETHQKIYFDLKNNFIH